MNCTSGEQLEFFKKQVCKDLSSRQEESKKTKTESIFGYPILILKSSVPIVIFTLQDNNSFGVSSLVVKIEEKQLLEDSHIYHLNSFT